MLGTVILGQVMIGWVPPTSLTTVTLIQTVLSELKRTKEQHTKFCQKLKTFNSKNDLT